MRKKILFIYGTRPEAIKIAPVIRMMRGSDALSASIAITGQHREMLDQVHSVFGIAPDFDLGVFEARQTLNALMGKMFTRLDPVLDQIRPDAVLVQGDTCSVIAGAMAAFYQNIPVIHLEAGLRSGDLRSPFPEEANRKLTSQIADLHLAPTQGARDNLIGEGVWGARIAVTGNTVIDALHYTTNRANEFTNTALKALCDSNSPIILVTSHRRENWGSRMVDISRALAEISIRLPDFRIVLPAHANPNVRMALSTHLEGKSNALVLDPLPYHEFAHLLARSHIVLTDSGGVQEEAPSLGKPVLVMRDNTERPEAIRAGTVRLIGTETRSIVEETLRLVNEPSEYAAMSRAVNPYGDGRAAVRCAAAIEELLHVGNRLPDFAPLP